MFFNELVKELSSSWMLKVTPKSLLRGTVVLQVNLHPYIGIGTFYPGDFCIIWILDNAVVQLDTYYNNLGAFHDRDP